MKRSLLFLFALMTTCGWSQSDINRADVYAIGDVTRFLAVDATNTEAGPAGLGVTWDFSGLPRTPEDDIEVTYADVSAAPNASMFPGANMVSIQDVDATIAYTFYNVTDSRFTLVGLDLPDVGVVTYSDESIWIDFPFGYQASQEDDFMSTYVFNTNGIQATAERTGNLMTTYDGFGTLILPNGTRLENVRRLKMEQWLEDDVRVAGTSVSTRVVTTTYNYFVEGDSAHVFQFTEGETTVTPPGLSFPAKIASYRDVDSPGPSTLASRGAHLTTQGGDFNSEVLVRNPTASAKSLTLQPYDGDGAALAPSTVNVAPGATSRVLQETYFTSAAKSFSSTGCDECIVSIGYRANLDSASTAQVHQAERFATEFTFYPGEWAYLFDGAAIVNAGDAAATIEAFQYDSAGAEIDKVSLETALEPGGKHLTIFNNLFSDRPDAVVTLKSSQPMAVMTLRISNDGRFLYENQPLPEVPAENDARWLAHITSESGGFDTDLYIHNTSESTKTITLQPFALDGTALDSVDVTVDGKGTQRFAKRDLLTGDAGHAAISGDPAVLVTVGYRSKVADSSTAPIHEGPPVGTEFYLYPGEWDVLFDGLALVNTGETATDITVTQIGDDGEVLSSAPLTTGLAPNAKFVGLLEGLIPENANSIIKVEASQPLAVLALRLSKDSRFLYGNNVLPQ